MNDIIARLITRGGTAAEWTAANPLLALNELGRETDTGYKKWGDGVTLWNALSYEVTGGGAVDSVTGSTVDNTDPANPVINADAAGAAAAAEVAAKAYADTLVIGLLDDRGNYDASVNTFPASGGSGTAGAIKKGDLWTISVAGTLGSSAVTAGDVVRALVDTPGQTVGNWVITENNIGYVPENSTNKQTDLTASATKYPTVNAVNAGLALKLNWMAMIHSHSGTFGPIDGNYHYFGMPNIAVSNTVGDTQTYTREDAAPITGTIIAVIITAQVTNGATCSNESCNVKIRNTTAATLNTVTTTWNYSTGANILKTQVITGLAIAVTAGDLCMTLIGNPNFATNPTGVIMTVKYIVQV